jgi:hypothetical protein
MELPSVELCIENDNSPMHAQSLESSMSTYDSIMQSLHDELNQSVDNAEFEGFELHGETTKAHCGILRAEMQEPKGGHDTRHREF